jgi:GTP-binding protein
MQTFSNATFLRAVGQPGDLLPPGPPEIAFAGRSNVGKSSAINALLGRNRLARISKTPGRTQTINFYEMGEGQRLVDLPGYGYARVSKLLREQWGKLVGAYLQDREGLAAVVVVMDARHPLTPLDLQLLGWLQRSRVLALLSKADKLSRADQAATLNKVRSQLSGEVRLFSSTTRQGVDECRELLAQWLEDESGPPQSNTEATRGNKRPPVKGI